jgi:hypothetical protein
MFLNPFRFSSRAPVAALTLLAALLVSGAAPPRTAADVAPQLKSIVHAALLQAPVNFVAWRVGVKSTGTGGVSFKPSGAMMLVCPTCNLENYYATAGADERYALTFDWLVTKSSSRAQTLAYIQQNVGALLPSFTAQQGTNNDGESWFYWSKSKEYVYVVTYSTKKESGFEVRVGHYLQKNVHYALYARLSDVQRADLGKAVRNFVQLGVQNGSDNFTSLRGPATDKDNNYFHTNVGFGEYLKSCTVDGIFSTMTATEGTAKWILECDTPALGGLKSDVEETIRAAVVNALPGGFTATTDMKYLGLDDYRWDRGSDLIAVEISSYDNHDGTFDYHVWVYHFLS